MSGVLGLTAAQGAIIAVLGGIFVVVAGGILYLRTRRVEEAPDIPQAMRPGPSDPDLETPLLAKLQGWGLLLVVFFVVWVPVVWLQEPSINLDQEEDLKTQAIERGRLSVLPFTEENQLGVGCVRCHGTELKGQAIQVAGTTVTSANLTTVCSRLDVEAILTTIEEGRARQIDGQEVLIMPSWSIRFAGALHDQQIGDIVQYLVSINRETVPFKDNRCINPDAGATPTPPASPTGGEETAA